MEKRNEITSEVEKRMSPPPEELGLSLATVVKSAIDKVLTNLKSQSVKRGKSIGEDVDLKPQSVKSGKSIGEVVDEVLRDERLRAAVLAAAESLKDKIDPKEVQELKQKLGIKNPGSGLGDDKVLLEQARELIKEMRGHSDEQTIKAEVDAATKDLSLSEVEVEGIRECVAAAVKAGASLADAIQDALPKEQNIWDTGQNKATRRAGELMFALFAQSKLNLADLDKYIAKDGDVDAVDENGLTPVHWAVKTQNAEALQHLIEAKAELDVQNPLNEHTTALMLASAAGLSEYVQMLLEAGANASATDQVRITTFSCYGLFHNSRTQVLERLG